MLEMPIPKYKYITTQEEAARAAEILERMPIIGVDSETTSLDTLTARMVLLQLGDSENNFVIDVRNDTPYSNVDPMIFKKVLTDPNKLKIVQNASYDSEVMKTNFGFYIENIYDTMLAEQLLHLGLHAKASLDYMVSKYLGIYMDKESGGTFSDYHQEFKTFQLDYAANDIVPLSMIRDLQIPQIQSHGLEDVCRLEFEFVKSLCEMELNGLTLDVPKWRAIVGEAEGESRILKVEIEKTLSKTMDQISLFDVSLVSVDSPAQLLLALRRMGFKKLENTSEKALSNLAGNAIIDRILEYRKLTKIMSTYGESLIGHIHPKTGRLHTKFKQLISTGRMSSNEPNLQNIPKKQKYRSCFIPKEGYSLITCDMASAELRIIANLSKDPIFLECYAEGIDLHTRTAAEINGILMSLVTNDMRNGAKSINFGLAYGLSKFGLAIKLGITEEKAQDMIEKYFNRYKGVKTYLDKCARDAVRQKFSTTISGRKRFYTLPPYDHPDYKKIKGGIERQGKNTGIQGSLVFNSNINGLGAICGLVEKEVTLETGFGLDTAIGVYSGNKDVYDLKLSNGIALGITLDHKIPTVNRVVDKEIFQDIPVKKLTKDDLIMVPLNAEEGAATNLEGYKYIKEHRKNIIVSYPLPTIMAPKLAFVLGCLIGDGSYNSHNYIRFCCPTIQKELFSKFNSYVTELFDYEPAIRIVHLNDLNRVPLPYSEIGSVFIRGFLKNIGLDYVVHRNKKIPSYFYTETIENRGALLNGLFSTDGGMGIKTGPSFTTVSEQLATDVHQLLFSLGINSHLKIYDNKFGKVYRLQVPKRFCAQFKKYIGFSVDAKQKLLEDAIDVPPKHGDGSIVPVFIPKLIEKVLRKSPTFFNDFTSNEKAHLRRLKLGFCSFNSWRKFYYRLPECEEKNLLSKYLNYDFCHIESLTYRGKEDTYDLICDNIHYFIANGIIVHNSNADTIKQSMIYAVDRLEKSGLDAKLVLTVHDELVVEARDDQRHEVADIVESSIIDGFGKYFSTVPMTTEALIGKCWLKGMCEIKNSEGNKCNSKEFKRIETDDKYGSKMVCAKCGTEI